MANLRICIMLLAVFGFINFLQESYAQTTNGIPDRFIPAEALVKKGDCEGAWSLAWNLAKKNDRDAIALPVHFTTMGMNPPGKNMPNAFQNEAYLRQLLTLYVYGSTSNEEFGMRRAGPHEYIPMLIQEILKVLNLGKAGEEISSCYHSSADRSQCVHLATSLKAILPFPEFVQVEEQFIRDHGGATCHQANY